MRWTEQQLVEWQEKHGVPAPSQPVDVSKQPFRPEFDSKALLAKGRARNGTMNKLETRYDQHLWTLRHAGDVLWHAYEAVKLRLADNTFYTCDFAVLRADFLLEMHEVKGFWQDSARVKTKVAASLYPFRFIAVMAKAKKHGGGWEVEEF